MDKHERQGRARIERLTARIERIDHKISQHTASDAKGSDKKVAEFEEEKERRLAELNYLSKKYPPLKEK